MNSTMQATATLILLIARLNRTYGVSLAVALLILDLLAIVSLLRGQSTLGHKIVWISIILLVPIAGLLLFLVWGRSQRDRPLLE